jgi:hypothetical protein
MVKPQNALPCSQKSVLTIKNPNALSSSLMCAKRSVHLRILDSVALIIFEEHKL